MWTKTFWAQTAERAVKTAAQATLALLTADEVFGLLSLDWVAVGSAAGLAALASVLMSIISAPVGPGDTPSLVRTVPRPSTEAVRILVSPDSGRATSDAVREVFRRRGPGGLQ